MQTDESPPEHQYAEAFRLMRYGSKDGTIVRTVWNSRNGVTPFGFHDRETGVELTHLPPWQAEEYRPHHRPAVGDLVFIDLDPEKALQMATDQVERAWDDERMPMRDAGRPKEEWVRIFWEDLVWIEVDGQRLPKGTPDLVEWTEAMDARLEERPPPVSNASEWDRCGRDLKAFFEQDHQERLAAFDEDPRLRAPRVVPPGVGKQGRYTPPNREARARKAMRRMGRR